MLCNNNATTGGPPTARAALLPVGDRGISGFGIRDSGFLRHSGSLNFFPKIFTGISDEFQLQNEEIESILGHFQVVQGFLRDS